MDDSTRAWTSLGLEVPPASTYALEEAAHVRVARQDEARSAAEVFAEVARWETSNKVVGNTPLVSKKMGRQDTRTSEHEAGVADADVIGRVRILVPLGWEARWDRSLKPSGRVRPQGKAELAGKHGERHEPTFEPV